MLKVAPVGRKSEGGDGDEDDEEGLSVIRMEEQPVI